MLEGNANQYRWEMFTRHPMNQKLSKTKTRNKMIETNIKVERCVAFYNVAGDQWWDLIPQARPCSAVIILLLTFTQSLWQFPFIYIEDLGSLFPSLFFSGLKPSIFRPCFSLKVQNEHFRCLKQPSFKAITTHHTPTPSCSSWNTFGPVFFSLCISPLNLTHTLGL